MKVEQRLWKESLGWNGALPGELGASAQLVFLFGSRSVIGDPGILAEARRAYPNARWIGCSTAGEIGGIQVHDDSLVLTAVSFDSTRIEGAWTRIGHARESRGVGRFLSRSLNKDGLVHVMVLSDGLRVNGTELVAGLLEALPPEVTVTGGLSADGWAFEETMVLCDGEPEAGAVAAIGFYGGNLRVGYGSLGGWDPFGPERVITRSAGNVLYELDGRPALDLYMEYLGEYAPGLPATGLRFPLSIRMNSQDDPVVRTILGVDRESDSMVFAGDVPQGAYARLMKANFERLIDGAAGAARVCGGAMAGLKPELAVLISCVGRKLVLKQRIEEEVEEVRDVLGAGAVLTGFYSYGEISPFSPNAKCEMHNQTMTITAFAEV